jgi:hypothetical protein
MDLVVGGGRYGEKAAKYLIAQEREFVIIDPDPDCRAALAAREAGYEDSLMQGRLDVAMQAFSDYSPEYVFPTAPVHVAAGLVCGSLGFVESTGEIQDLLAAIPPELVFYTKGGSVYLSLNRGNTCIPDCPSPDTCPVTGEDRTVPLHDILRRILPDAFILESVQLAPGLGALRGGDIAALLDRASGTKGVAVGTACRCHGVVTVLVSAGDGV